MRLFAPLAPWKGWRTAAFCSALRCLSARLRSDQRGVTALIFGLVVPVLMAGVAATMDYSRIMSRRTELQAAADGAAMAAAKELTLANANDRVVEVAKAAALSKLAMNSGQPAPKVEAAVVNNRSGVEVTITENFVFMMGHYLGYPNVDVSVKAAAKLSGSKRKLCMIGLETSPLIDAIRIEMYAKITADGCDVQSDSVSVEGIKAYNESLLKASRTCSAGGYKASRTSNFSPTPITDCPQIGDPLIKRTPPSVDANCYPALVVDRDMTVPPGTYCGGIKVIKGGVARLQSGGVYVLKDGKLWVQDYSGIMGENVGFYFVGDTSVLDIDPLTFVSLTAPKSGSMAGILFFEDRNAPLARKFRIASDYARQLLGTIYLPRGMFYVGSNRPVADQSAYTVVVARQIRMDAGPNLVLNTNYGSTDVPVPEGVGPIGDSNVSLAQ